MLAVVVMMMTVMKMPKMMMMLMMEMKKKMTMIFGIRNARDPGISCSTSVTEANTAKLYYRE